MWWFLKIWFLVNSNPGTVTNKLFNWTCNDFTLLSFSFLICKMEIIIICETEGYWLIKWDNRCKMCVYVYVWCVCMYVYVSGGTTVHARLGPLGDPKINQTQLHSPGFWSLTGRELCASLIVTCSRMILYAREAQQWQVCHLTIAGLVWGFGNA